MKLRTQFIAWAHIFGDIPFAVFVLPLFLVGGIGLLTGLVPLHSTGSWPNHITLGSATLGIALVCIVLLLADIIPWLCLLKKRPWAWWYLTILYGLGTSLILLQWIPFRRPGNESASAAYESLGIFLYFGITFLILLGERPKHRKSPTRRRRRRKTPTASTRRRRTRRRRSSTYDY